MIVTIPCYPSVTAFVNDQNRIKKLKETDMKLSDLNPGDEFEYANSKLPYRRGKFIVLDSNGNYLRPAATERSRFIFSCITNKVVNHFVDLEVIVREINMKSQKEMGHFIGWKFGVPVKVSGRHNLTPYTDQVLLIKETDRDFTVQFTNFIKVYSKQHYCYELIPHQTGGREPVYPVCKNDCNTTYCNVRVNRLRSVAAGRR